MNARGCKFYDLYCDILMDGPIIIHPSTIHGGHSISPEANKTSKKKKKVCIDSKKKKDGVKSNQIKNQHNSITNTTT